MLLAHSLSFPCGLLFQPRLPRHSSLVCLSLSDNYIYLRKRKQQRMNTNFWINYNLCCVLFVSWETVELHIADLVWDEMQKKQNEHSVTQHSLVGQQKKLENDKRGFMVKNVPFFLELNLNVIIAIHMLLVSLLSSLFQK